MKLARQRGTGGGTLQVRVSGAAALEIDHMIPQLIDRINTYYGYEAVSRIRLEQGPLPRPKRQRTKRLRTLTDSEEMALKSSLSGIQDPNLKENLEELGRLIKSKR